MSAEHTELAKVDPIAAFIARSRPDLGVRPTPLDDMEIDVTIVGGLALVQTKRTFRNGEPKPIEALLTFPVPVNAAFFGLEVRRGGRTQRGVARARAEARETYEEALEGGRPAVLHEELLRGVHMLSIGNLAPGGVVKVTTRWSTALNCVDDAGRLRIPLTVGDVYGDSGLPETDELTHGPALGGAKLRVRHDARAVRLANGFLAGDAVLHAAIPSNAPVDLAVEGWKPGSLPGATPNRQGVELRIQPSGCGEGDLDIAVLVDCSGSMHNACAGPAGSTLSKHEAVQASLADLCGHLRGGDRLALWEFNHEAMPVGGGQPGPAGSFRHAVDRLRRPSGGTAIGAALERVFAATETRDVLLITDGMSYALDVHRLARAGRRVWVVLVGEDSLEATVGHLAALTGGGLHFSFGFDVAAALRAAVRGSRARGRAAKPVLPAAEIPPDRISVLRGNARIEAAWTDERFDGPADDFSEAVAAYAASLALASVNEAGARRLAVEAGLVTHQTSLVFVGEDGEVQPVLPTTRKVDLPTPRTAHAGGRLAVAAQSLPLRREEVQDGAAPAPPCRVIDAQAVPSTLAELTRLIDWNETGGSLAAGRLDGQTSFVARAIQELEGYPDIKAEARVLGLPPRHLVIALIAAEARGSRHAGRVRRRLLRGVDESAFAAFAGGFDPGWAEAVQ